MLSKRTLVYASDPRSSRKKVDEFDVDDFYLKLNLNSDEKMDLDDYQDDGDDNIKDDDAVFIDKGYNGLVYPKDGNQARSLLGNSFLMRSKSNSRKYLTSSNAKTRKGSAVEGLITNIELMTNIVKNSANPSQWNKCIIEINASILCHRYIQHITGEILNNIEINELFAKLKSKDFVEKNKVYKLCLVKFHECLFKCAV